MQSLARILKPKFLGSFLEDALEGLVRPNVSSHPEDWRLSVADEQGFVLMQVGAHPDPDASLPPLSPQTADGSGTPALITSPVCIRVVNTTANGLCWQLALSLGGPHSREAIQSILEQELANLAPALGFLTRSLSEIVDREIRSRAVGEEALEQYRELSLLQRAVINLNQSRKMQDVARALIKECSSVFPAEYGMVFFHDEATNRFEPQFLADKHHYPKMERMVESALFHSVIKDDRGEIINDLAGDSRWENEVPGLSSVLIIPLRAPGITLGALVLGAASQSETFTAAHLKKSGTLASVSGIATANAFHFEQVQHILVALINAMATAIDSRDTLTAGHSSRVAQYSLALAKSVNNDQRLCPELCFTDLELQEIFYAGLLHDVGKIGIREEVLTKATRLPSPHMDLLRLRLSMWGDIEGQDWNSLFARIQQINSVYDLGKDDIKLVDELTRTSFKVGDKTLSLLTEEERERFLTPRGNLTTPEWEEIQRHPEESHRILRNIPFTSYFPNILTIVLQHHERLDGSGYPMGLKAEDLLPQSRIMAIVDIYDSLIRDRHYKKALPEEEALAILRQEAMDGKVDQNLVNLFINILDDIDDRAGQLLSPDSIRSILV